MFCTNCGTQVNPNADYCSICGERIRKLPDYHSAYLPFGPVQNQIAPVNGQNAKPADPYQFSTPVKVKENKGYGLFFAGFAFMCLFWFVARQISIQSGIYYDEFRHIVTGAAYISFVIWLAVKSEPAKNFFAAVITGFATFFCMTLFHGFFWEILIYLPAIAYFIAWVFKDTNRVAFWMIELLLDIIFLALIFNTF